MADIDAFELVQVINNLAERNTLEVQIKRDRYRVKICSHVFEALSLGVPAVTTRHALEPLNLAAVLSVTPAPLLDMR
jgi:hypothetical protein